MPCDYRKYPKEWRAVSRMIRDERAKKRCERCNVRQYGVGQWRDGSFGFCFYYAGGNLYYDDFQYTGSYSEAAEARDYLNEYAEEMGEPRYIVIVLTVAHQCECDPLCADPDHLLALCQRCHLRQDAKLHAKNAARTKRRKRNNLELFEITG